MSRWLEMFREAPVQIDTPVQLGQKGAARSKIELTAPNRANCTGIETENRAEWEATDWRAYLDERAGVREHLGEVSRHEAERLAFDDCAAHWLVKHPPPSTDDSDGCVHCHQPLGPDGVPVLAGTAHTWLHSACHSPWLTERRRHAVEALRAMGIEAAQVLE